MDTWMKAPIVMGTLIMIAAHFFGNYGLEDAFGLGAIMSVLGLFVLIDFISPANVRLAVLRERARCEAEFERQEIKRRHFRLGEITYGQLCDPHS